MSISNLLAETTFRIEISLAGGRTSTGSGFLFSIHHNQETDTSMILLVTNKHVVEGGVTGKIIVSATKDNGEVIHTDIGLRQFQDLWIKHPEDSVDLIACNFSPIIDQLREQGLIPRIKALASHDIPTKQELDALSFVEDILMVGYPNGLWDSVNNYPLFRRGITASHAGKDFEGKKEFVVDIAAFPGSSGSPVFLFNEGSYATPEGLALGTRLKLLGILYAGPQYQADGQIIIQTVPTTQTPVPRTSIPMNLGYVISSQVVMRFEEVFHLAS